MSIHHEVSVHCDTCGNWEYGNSRSTRARRKAGWVIWQDEYNHWWHTCPGCVRARDPTIRPGHNTPQRQLRR